jgi:amino acid adenylation domain-containing protein
VRDPAEPIAIIGMAGRFPGAADLDAFWRLLSMGGDAVGTVPPGRWLPEELGDTADARITAGGFLEHAEYFDAGFFGIAPREALLMDPQQRVLLEQAWLAMNDAGLHENREAAGRTGVYIGASAGDYAQKAAMMGVRPDRPSLLAQMPSTLAARIGYAFDLKGPALTIDLGCASSVAAIKLAADALRRGEVDVALAGAVAVQSTPALAHAAQQAELLSPDGRCRPFAAEPQGLGLSEGVGVVVLARLDDALANGHAVHAVLRAATVSQNGATNGMLAPSVAAQSALARDALAACGLGPAEISYVEAHGVGTPAGDAAEAASLGIVFAGRDELPAGSVKGNIGHTLAAAGMAGLLKTVLQFRHGMLAPSLHADPAPKALNGGGLVMNTALTPWTPAAERRLALVNAFAINGGNGVLVVEQAPDMPAAAKASGPVLLLVGARNEAALRERLAALAAWLDANPVALPDLACTLNRVPRHFAWRAAFVAADIAELQRQMADAGAGGTHALFGEARQGDETMPVLTTIAAQLCREAAADSAAARLKLMAAAQLFVTGADLVMPPRPGARRVGMLPPYPFARQRFWVGEEPAIPPQAEPARAEGEWFALLRRESAAVLRMPEAALRGDAVLSRLGLDSLLAFDLRARLQRAGAPVPEPVALLSGDSLAELAAAMAETPVANAPPVLAGDSAGRFAPFPLTDIQLAYWLGRRPDFVLSGPCHVYWEFAADRPLDPARLEDALNRLIGTHDMLRAVVGADGTQRVLPEVPRYRIARRPAAERDALWAEMTRDVFDPAQWPLFRIAVSEGDHEMHIHLSVDLLIIDVPSLAVLLDEWGRLARDPTLALAPPGIAFRDYVLHEKAQEDGPAARTAQAYWEARTESLLPAPRLPGMKALDARTDWAWTRHTGRLESDAWTALQTRARETGITSVAVLVSAFAETLAHWAESPRFTLNLTVNDRASVHPDIGRVIGDFTSTVLLGMELGGPAPFAQRAAGTGAELACHLGQTRHTGVKVLQQRGPAGAGELMPVVFTSMLGYGSITAALGRLAAGATRTPQVWLDAQVMEEEGALLLTWDAIDALFPDGLIGGIFDAWLDAVRALARDPALWQCPLREWLAAQERARRQRRNATEHPFTEALLHEPFLHQALSDPNRIAVIAPDRTLTYGALLSHALSVAEAIGQVEPGRLVAVALPKGWQQLAAAIGVLLAGGAYLPIDPALPEARRRHLLKRGEAQVVLTLGAQESSWPAGARRIAVDTLAAARLPGALPARRAAPDDLAYVIFTSGSTGEPKGVMIEHRAALNTVLDVNDRFAVGPEDRVLGLSSLSFDLSVYDVFGVLAAGGAVVLPDLRSAGDPAHLAALVEAHRVTIWNSVPMFVQLFLEGEPSAAALRMLRLVMMSGDWIPPGLPARLHAANPSLSVVSLGGATEASIWSIAYPVNQAPLPGWSSIPYGYPMRNQRFHVLDAAMQDVQDWVAGELFIGGAGLARGYWRDPETTAARFVTHPVTGERLYRTGDLGRYREDGVIEFLGRTDGQVKIGGFRIELGEVETALSRLPGVGQAAVVVRNDSSGRASLAAFYVPAPHEPAPEPEILRAQLAAVLPAYMMPVTFQCLAALPLNANEKVDRKALTAWQPPSVAEPTPQLLQDAAMLETKLLQIWHEVLGNPLLPADGKFFEYGAHSFHAVDANARINRTLALGCTVTDIFEHPTARALCAALLARQQPAAPKPDRTPVPAAASRLARRRQFRASATVSA